MFNYNTIERFLNYKRIYLPDEEAFKNAIKTWKKQKPFFVLGTFSATELKREKIIRLDTTITLEKITEPLTRSEVAKAILETLPQRKRYIFPFSKKDFEAMRQNFAGQYARIGKYAGEYAYVDIKSFYFTVYSRFLGAEYRKGRRFGVRKHLRLEKQQIEFLAKDKLLRNTIFGIMRNSTRTIIKQGKVIIQQTHNKFLNPMLANLIYDLSKAIMYKAITEFNAIYYNTDGAILPADKVQAFRQFINELGFRTEVKAQWQEGVIVKGIGVYGGFSPLEPQTLHFERIKYPESREGEVKTNIDLDDDEIEFLLKRYQFWLERI